MVERREPRDLPDGREPGRQPRLIPLSNLYEVGGCERRLKRQKPLKYKAQTKREGIPKRGYLWGYPQPLKDTTARTGYS